jgi:hypothetical protein
MRNRLQRNVVHPRQPARRAAGEQRPSLIKL